MRAHWANEAVKAFMSATHTDREDALCDLLCDLMHWADANKDVGEDQPLDFEAELNRARMHYQEELLEAAYELQVESELS